MTQLAVQQRTATYIASRRPWWQQHWRVFAGIFTAAALFTLVTMLPIYVPELVRFSRAGYLVAVIVAALVGGRWTAWLAVPAAALLADYYVTAPLHTISLLWDPDDITFLAVTALVAALAVVAARSITRSPASRDEDLVQVVDRVLRAHTNTRTWAAVYSTEDGGEYAIWCPGQATEGAAQQLADGVHGLSCSGCERCTRSDVVV